MATGEYLKVAAGQLRRASQALKQQAQGLLSERERTIRLRSSEIDKHHFDLRLKQARLFEESDNRVKAQLSRDIQVIQREIDRKSQDIDRANRQLGGFAQSKQRTASRLDGRAQELELQASAPELSY